MQRIGIFYATREGHTARIAECVARRFRDFGIQSEIVNLGDVPSPVPLQNYCAVVLAASVHAGEHEPEMVEFVRLHRAQLEAMPSAFLSVTLSQAGVEMPSATPEQKAQSAAGVQQVLDRFYSETTWHPAYVQPVAGALRYTKYNFLKRFLMKRISKQAGGSTDTSRDHIYTNWAAVESFTTKLAEAFELAQPAYLPGARISG